MTKYVLIHGLLLVGMFSIIGCEPNESTNLTVMSYNIRHGEGLDTLLDLSRAANIINRIEPDLCALQEVDDHCTRSGGVGQTEYISQKTNMVGTFGKFMDFQGGEYGMANMTRKPIISSKVLQLPDAKYEPRSSIVQEVEIADGCIITFANVHFDWIGDDEGSQNRVQQAKTLFNYLDSLNRPIIITGDFNCEPDSPTMKYFEEMGFSFFEKGIDNLSFQGRSTVEIDHLIYKSHGDVVFTEKSIRLLEEPIVSDHRPLVVELEVRFKG